MKLDFSAFAAMLKDPSLEQDSQLNHLAQLAKDETQKRFGKTVDLYTPLYISNRCSSVCTYCNYASNRKIPRSDLPLNMSALEMAAIKDQDIDDILLLSGEISEPERLAFILDYVRQATSMFTKVGLEIFPCSLTEYQYLHDAGVSYITLYQETYDRHIYTQVHRSGQKADYDYRYQAPKRLLQAGLKGIGMGVLIGLGDPYQDLLDLARHLIVLKNQFWERDFSISFPRIRDRRVAHFVDERFLAKAIFLYRLLFPDITLVLSTRESQSFRNGMAGLGINKMSAGSRTTVGGYIENHGLNEQNEPSCGQFDIDDQRTVHSVITDLKNQGLSPVYKNHERVYN